MLINLPPPGLNGDYTGTCIVCLRGTDTVIGVRGEAEFMVACLIGLGLGMDEAQLTYELSSGADAGRCFPGVRTTYIRLCAACASRRGLGAPGLLTSGAGVPTYVQSPEVG